MEFVIGKSISKMTPHNLYRLHIETHEEKENYCDFVVVDGKIVLDVPYEKDEEFILMEDIITILKKFLSLTWNRQCHTIEDYSFMSLVKNIFPFDMGQCMDEKDNSEKEEYEARMESIRLTFDEVVGRDRSCTSYYNHIKNFRVTYFDANGVEHEVEIKE